MLYYNRRDDESVAVLNCYDWTKANSDIVFDELVITRDEDFVFLTMQVIDITRCKKSKDDNWIFPINTKARLKLALKPYQKQDYKTKEWQTIEPSRIERALIAVLDRKEFQIAPAYRGRLNLQDGSHLEPLITGKDMSGQPVTETAWKIFEMCLLTLHPLEGRKSITDADLKATEAKSQSSFRGGGQKYYDTLCDRFKWVQQQMTKKYPALRIESMWDLTEYGFSEQPVPDEIKSKAYDFYQSLLVFMGGK